MHVIGFMTSSYTWTEEQIYGLSHLAGKILCRAVGSFTTSVSFAAISLSAVTAE